MSGWCHVPPLRLHAKHPCPPVSAGDYVSLWPPACPSVKGLRGPQQRTPEDL